MDKTSHTIFDDNGIRFGSLVVRTSKEGTESPYPSPAADGQMTTSDFASRRRARALVHGLADNLTRRDMWRLSLELLQLLEETGTDTIEGGHQSLLIAETARRIGCRYPAQPVERDEAGNPTYARIELSEAQRFDVKAGQRFIVALQEPLAAGYHYRFSASPGISVVDDAHISVAEAEDDTEMPVGGAALRELTFTTTETGEFLIRFWLQRPWDAEGSGKENELSLTVIAN